MFDIGVVGLVFFEVFVPGDAEWPPPGEERWVSSLPVGLGGALNSASVARALGLEVTLVSPRGAGLTDRAIASEVARLGIPSPPWPASSDAAITLIRSTPRDRAFLSAVAPDALEDCPALPRARYLHVGGLGDAEAVDARLAEARAAGARVSVSAGWDPPRLEALRARRGPPPWDLFFCNTKEADAIGLSLDEMVGRVAHDIVVSDGPRGAHALIGGARCHAEGRPVRDVVDTTGAGDALAAAVVSGLCRGLDAPAALERAARVAERVITIRGGVVEAALLSDLRFPPPANAARPGA